MSISTSSIVNSLKLTLPRRTGVLIAVSGGVDSMTLLHACIELTRLLKLHIEVAHIDHSLRVTSKSDARFVKEYCNNHGLKCHILVAKKPKANLNTEAWGREVRYKFFAKIVKLRKLSCVLTAHTANDVAETLLMRLISNRDLTSIAQYHEKLNTIRPLINITRVEIESYARENGINYVTDESNYDNKYTRNKVRNKLIPFIKSELETSIVQILSERSLALDEDIETLRQIAIKSLPDHKFGSRGWVKSMSNILKDLRGSLKWRICEEALLPIVNYRIGRRASLRFLAFMTSNSANFELSGGLKLIRKAGGLRLLREKRS